MTHTCVGFFFFFFREKRRATRRVPDDEEDGRSIGVHKVKTNCFIMTGALALAINQRRSRHAQATGSVASTARVTVENGRGGPECVAYNIILRVARPLRYALPLIYHRVRLRARTRTYYRRCYRHYRHDGFPGIDLYE